MTTVRDRVKFTARFWKYVPTWLPNDVCWEWKGSRTVAGYGVMTFKGETFLAHRVSINIAKKLPMPDEALACHHCDNPSCVNPMHLYVGDARSNSHDAVKRNRIGRLDPAVVVEMRRLYWREHVPYKELSTRFGMSYGRAALIIREQTYGCINWRNWPDGGNDVR